MPRSLMLILLLVSSTACAQSVQTALRDLVEDAAPPGGSMLATAYARRGYEPYWLAQDVLTAQAHAILQELHNAESYGLRSSDYESLLPPVEALATPAEQARLELSLSHAVSQFLHDLNAGRVPPAKAGFELPAGGSNLNTPALLSSMASAAQVGDVVASVEPAFLHYRLLKQVLARYRALATQEGLTQLPAIVGRPVKTGDLYVGTPQLRRLLHATGDLPETDVRERVVQSGGSEWVVESALADALRRFQARHGLKPDGVIGPSTWRALTTPMSQRVRQIELTLERWRWLPRFESPPVIVNIPQFKLFAFRSTRDRRSDILQMEVIVGQTHPWTQTPIFQAQMRYLIFRPYWDVPHDIAVRELLPKERALPGYLAGYLDSQRMEIVANNGKSSPAVLPITAENLKAVAAERARLRQRPGPDNSLGLIKFVLPNPHDVYLHATPARELFRQSQRAFSHGCIRVSDPVALATVVLSNMPGGWTADKIDAAMNGTDTLRVTLAKPVPVLIVYGTVLAAEDGSVSFFEDIYGHDRRLEALLGWAPASTGKM